MPVCSHCGKEVSEGVSFCPDCGERLKKGFTPEETDKYIRELEASVEEEKPAKKTKTTKKQLIVGIVVCIIAIIVIVAVATPRLTHNTVAEALAGSPRDFVDFEVVRISPFFGGIAEGDPYYAFVVYDVARDDIMVLAKRKDITFEPEEMDFVKMTGVLRESPIENETFPIVVYASKVEFTPAPPDWG